MLLYKNGRFYSDKFSFLLPEGFYFEDDPEVNYEHGFCAWPPGRDYLCVWHIYENSRGSAVELANWLLPECGFVGLSPVTPIQVSGLSGHYLLYKNRRNQYYEARFDLGDGEELSFLVETAGEDIRGFVGTPAFHAALSGIQIV